jgi:triphosphoribosyl-dephospho-CoA synthase
MDGSTFFRSLFALRSYFPHMAQAGWQGLLFARLQALGLQAESRMLAVTRGINTHRGAIFGLGLLCASAGQVRAQELHVTPQHLRDVMLATWGQALTERAQVAKLSLALSSSTSHGQQVARRFGLRSAGDEAALGFPCLFEVTWPALQLALERGAGERAARVHALFATMAVLDDTNLVHRGGMEGMRFAQSLAEQFLASGSVFQADWLAQARAVHTAFVRRNLSPGGAADVLASACWMNAVCEPSPRAAIAVSGRGDQRLALAT